MTKDYEYKKIYESDHDAVPNFSRLYDLGNEEHLSNAMQLLDEKYNLLDADAQRVTSYKPFQPENGLYSILITTYAHYLEDRAVCELFEAVEDLIDANEVSAT